MTKAQFRERVKLEGRVKTSTNLDGLIDSLAMEILTDYTNKARYPELLVTDAELTLVDEQSIYALPDDYQTMAELRYGVGPTPVSFYKLDERGSYNSRRSYHGYPRFYFRSSEGIHLQPYLQIRTTDQLFLSYYRLPTAIWTEETDPFPVPRLETTILKEVISRIQRFHGSMPEAGAMAADAQNSFIAAESGR